ncbi:MAG: hypothetical protein AAFO81_03295 [Pseudomonadota bacterium]
MSLRYSVLAALVFFCNFASACATDGASPFHEHRTPPQEALEACSTAEVAQACSFTGDDGELVEGTCEAPEGKPLACRPAGERRGGRGGRGGRDGDSQ